MENALQNYDVIFVLPYLFSDHPSFPEGVLKRELEAAGFSVGIIQTPRWQSVDSFREVGQPNLFFAIISGPIDSVVLNYTSALKRRKEDLYQLDGSPFFEGADRSIKSKIRPDRVVTLFANKLREAYKGVQILIGGMEASQRRFAHYDFQVKKIKRSILLDSKADLLVEGAGEKQVVAIAQAAVRGEKLKELSLAGTVYLRSNLEGIDNLVELPSYEAIIEDSKKLVALEKVKRLGKNSGAHIVQRHQNRFVISAPATKYSGQDLDNIYAHNYRRNHLQGQNYSPALRMNLFSVTSHRGCGGGCSFCSITEHEGKLIVSRSVDSILKEIDGLTKHPNWRGVVSDIGGASAEMFGSSCSTGGCSKASCLMPNICNNYVIGQEYRELLMVAREAKGVKQVFIGSGLRYDLLLKNPLLLEEIMKHHTGKFLRVAPEHSEDSVLKLMGKPSFEVFSEFVQLFNSINRNLTRKIKLYPYLVIGHPGESAGDVIKMKAKFKKLNMPLESVQIFTPTPGTNSTAMFVSGYDELGNKIEVERDIMKLVARKDGLFSF